MLRKKQGFPQVDELLLVTITRIHHHSVFVNIDEYDKGGMIHISEISPGRIRNIRDFVEEGKVRVCKVLRVDKIKGHIDLSLRRVNEGQRRQKVDEIKQEQIVERIIEYVAKKNKIDVLKFYDDVTEKILQKFDSCYTFFEDVVMGEAKLEDYFTDSKLLPQLKEIIFQRIKTKEVEVKGHFMIKSYESDGVEIIKQILSKALEKGNDKTKISYIGAGKYKTIVKAGDYKTAESVLNNMIKAAGKYSDKNAADCNFVRDD